MKNYKDNIILIGPLATGKSFIAEKLSLATGLCKHPVDKLKWYYRHKNGYNLSTSTQILRTQGFEALISFAQKYFGPNDLENLLHTFCGIVDLGATDTHCQDLSQLQRLIDVFNPFKNIFLILPSANERKTIEILEERLIKRYEHNDLKRPVLASYLKMNRLFIQSESARLLAKHVIYVEDKSTNEIVHEILLKSNFLNDKTATAQLQRVS